MPHSIYIPILKSVNDFFNMLHIQNSKAQKNEIQPPPCQWSPNTDHIYKYEEKNARQIDHHHHCLRLFMLCVCHLQGIVDRHQQYASTWYKTSKTWNRLVLQFLCMSFQFSRLYIYFVRSLFISFQCIQTFLTVCCGGLWMRSCSFTFTYHRKSEQIIITITNKEWIEH